MADEKDTKPYELFYSTGGHGGPYYGLNDAINGALELVGRATGWIYIVSHNDWSLNPGKRADQIASVIIKPAGTPVTEPAPHPVIIRIK